MGAGGRARRWIVSLCGLIAVMVAGTAACTFMFRWEDDVLPRVLGPVQLIASEQESGWREGCSYAAFRLADDVVRAIDAQGLAFFGSDTHPPWDDPRNPYGPWQQTPIPDLKPQGDHRIYALGAAGGCKYSTSVYTVDAEAIAARTGSYYLLTQNNEGMVLVIPHQRLVLYLYFG